MFERAVWYLFKEISTKDLFVIPDLKIHLECASWVPVAYLKEV